MFHTEAVEKFKTHILCSVNFFPPENSPFYERLWKNAAQTDRLQMTV